MHYTNDQERNFTLVGKRIYAKEVGNAEYLTQVVTLPNSHADVAELVDATDLKEITSLNSLLFCPIRTLHQLNLK